MLLISLDHVAPFVVGHPAVDTMHSLVKDRQGHRCIEIELKADHADKLENSCEGVGVKIEEGKEGKEEWLWLSNGFGSGMETKNHAINEG